MGKTRIRMVMRKTLSAGTNNGLWDVACTNLGIYVHPELEIVLTAIVKVNGELKYIYCLSNYLRQSAKTFLGSGRNTLIEVVMKNSKR